MKWQAIFNNIRDTDLSVNEHTAQFMILYNNAPPPKYTTISYQFPSEFKPFIIC